MIEEDVEAAKRRQEVRHAARLFLDGKLPRDHPNWKLCSQLEAYLRGYSRAPER